MKIGILTFWGAQDNYGQVLQNYALQEYLISLGHDVFTIRYNRFNDRIIIPSPVYKKMIKALNPKELLTFAKRQLTKRAVKKEFLIHNRQFDEFRKKYIKQSDVYYQNFDELKNNPPEADCYIVGSDQVWNFSNDPLNLVQAQVKAFFLDFGLEKTKKISYAASWGKSKISADFIKEISPLLEKFHAVSVREETGICVCDSCEYTTSKWVCDPTMLINSSEYNEIIKSSNLEEPKEKYILFYYLNNGTKFKKKKVYEYAKVHNLRVVYITANSTADKIEKTYATVPEWLNYVKNAEFVVTNSFHCCVFSILYGKKFGAIKLDGINSGMNSRLDSLFNIYNLKSRYITDVDFSSMEQPYSVDLNNSFINESKKYLIDNL